MLPHPLFTRAILVRAAVLWLGVRLMIAFLGLPDATLLVPTGVFESALVLLVTVALSAGELHRRGELVLLGSAGYAPEVLVVLGALPVLPLEFLFALLVTG